MEKSCRKYAPKASHRPQFLRIRSSERGLSKTFKKSNFIFSFEPSPFNGQSYKKQEAWN